MSKPEFNIIPSHKIDRQQWDDCIQNSNSPLIYAHTYYLDHMADNWSGIAVNGYEAVMPVPWKKKFGIRYCYDVPFIQQLGIFSASNTNYEALFLQQLFSFCKYGDHNFNYSNNVKANSKTNCIIDLSSGYENIFNNYKDDLVNNIKKASKQELVYTKSSDYKNAIDIYKTTYGNRLTNTIETDYKNFETLCDHLHQQEKLLVRSVTNTSNKLLSVALFIKDDHRIYNIMNSTFEAGRKTEANHFLLDQVIKEFAGSNLIFDFEGSDIPGIKSFYEKFGAINQPYYSLHFNKLSPLIRWIKK